MLLELVLRFVC